MPAEAARRLRYVFEGDRVTLLEDGKSTGAGTVTLHPVASPKALDVLMTEGPGRGQKAEGIYEVAGDRLTLCIGPGRPAGFRSAGPAALVELERVRPGDERP
jgi:uncharacterized protein (TIGR03067 family)